jgi:hypothetical protein
MNSRSHSRAGFVKALMRYSIVHSNNNIISRFNFEVRIAALETGSVQYKDLEKPYSLEDEEVAISALKLKQLKYRDLDEYNRRKPDVT